jgi:RNA polymerase sigma-70 factor (ECF subfamily)
MRNDDHHPDDSEIIRRVLDGDVHSFETLMTKYEALVFAIAKRHVPLHDVEETAQNIFIRVYQSLPGFKGKGAFRHWLSSIALRTCYDYWRKAYQSREIPMSSLSRRHRDWLEEVLSDESEQQIEEKGREKEAVELLDWALGKLSAEDRMVIELLYLEGLSGREAADLLGWSLANVKVRAFRSRQKLRKLLTSLSKKVEND